MGIWTINLQEAKSEVSGSLIPFHWLQHFFQNCCPFLQKLVFLGHWHHFLLWILFWSSLCSILWLVFIQTCCLASWWLHSMFGSLWNDKVVITSTAISPDLPGSLRPLSSDHWATSLRQLKQNISEAQDNLHHHIWWHYLSFASLQLYSF